MITFNRYTIFILMLLAFSMGLYGIMSSYALASFFHQKVPLSEKKSREVISLFRGADFIGEENGYSYGYEYRHESKFIAYEVYYFPVKALTTFDKVTRLDGIRYHVSREKIQGFKCNYKTLSKCESVVVNYVSLKPCGSLNINKDTILDFIELKHDIEDVSLASLLDIARNPLFQIIDGGDMEINNNRSKIIIDANFKFFILNSEKLKKYSINSIDLVPADDGRREYLLRYCKIGDPYCQIPIQLYIRKSNINNHKYSMRVRIGPIT